MQCVLAQEDEEVRVFKLTAETDAEFELFDSLFSFLSRIDGGMFDPKPITIRRDNKTFSLSQRRRRKTA